MNRSARHRTPAAPAPPPGASGRSLRYAVLALALAVPPAARAAVDRWTPFGPGEGSLQSLAASTRGDLYATTAFSVGEIWQRPAAAVSWRWRGAGLGAPGLPGVTALAIHPKNPNSLWAVASTPGGALQNVYRSTDAGASWRKVHTGAPDFQIVGLTIAPTPGSVVLLAETGRGTPKRVLRSADLGATWTPVEGVVGPIAAPPDQPNTIYALKASGAGVAKSTDAGRTFRPTGALPIVGDDRILALHATYGRPAIVLASLERGGLFRSIDGAATWRRVGFVNLGPGVLASEPANPKKIYAAVSGDGIYASDRGGQNTTFRQIDNFNFTPLQVVSTTALVAAPGGPYFVAGNELYRVNSQDFFERVATPGIEAFGVAEVRIHPLDPRYLMVRTYTGCLDLFCPTRTLLSTDGGATFTRLGAQTQPRRFLDYLDLAFDPNEPNRWLIATGVGTLLHDPGEPGLGHSIGGGPGTSATVEFAAGGAILVGGFFGILRTEDRGGTWVTSLDGTIPPSPEHPAGGRREIAELTANPYDPSRLIARTLEFTSGLPRDPGDPVLFKSADAGKSWTVLREGNADVEFIPEAPMSFYLLFASGSGTELRRSDDFGATSVLVHTFPTLEAASDVATDPHAPGDLYAATRLGVRRSRDGGATWEATAGGFNPFGPYRRWVEKVQVAPDAAGRLIASPLDGGLFENRLSD